MKPWTILIASCWLGTLAMAAATEIAPRFQEVFRFNLGSFWCENHLSVADLDGDGRKDIVLMATGLATPVGPPWSYVCRAIQLLARPDGLFAESVLTNYAGRYGYAAVTGDLNNDGAVDLILREQSATHVLLNDGHGTFAEVWTGGPEYYQLTLVDVSRDGFLDFVSGTQTGQGGLIELFTNDGTGTRFAKTLESRLYGGGSDSISTVLSVNLNADDRPDIAAREIYGGRLVTLFGSAGAAPFVEQKEERLGERTGGSRHTG